MTSQAYARSGGPGALQAPPPNGAPPGWQSQSALYSSACSNFVEQQVVINNSEDDELQLREQHTSFRTGAGQRLQRQSTSCKASAPPGAPGLLSASSKKGRRRWGEDGQGDDASAPPDLLPAGRPQGGEQQLPQHAGGPNTGHIVRMRRGEAWSKFLAYEGCCQVCMQEGAAGVREASYFLASGCEPLRAGLGISSLLLPQVLASQMAASVGPGGQQLDLGNEIVWDDYDGDERRLNAAAFHNHMSVMKVRVARLELPQTGSNMLSRLVCRNSDYSAITVHFRLIPTDLRGVVDVPYRLRKDGGVLPGSPVFDLQPEQCNHEVLLEVVQGNNVLARGKVACRRLWQIGMEHSAEEEFDDDESDAELCVGAPKSICSWLKGDGDGSIAKGSTALWVNVFDTTPHPGKVLLMVQRTQREMPGTDGPRDEPGSSKGALKVSSCQAYDYILLAALRAQGCSEQRLEVTGEWAWLLQAFACHYGVRSNYAVMSHLRWVLRPGVASVSQACFELLSRQLRPLLEQEALGSSLTQQEATMLARIKSDTEELLKLVFEHYYLLSSSARKGILDGACSPPPGLHEFPPLALVAGVQLFVTMRDLFHPDDVQWLSDRFRVAAKGRWGRLASLCDDGSAGQQEACSPLMTGTAPLRQNRPATRGQGSPAGKANQLYSKLLRVAAAIQQDLEFDRQLQDVPGLLPSSLNLPWITTAEFCTNFVVQLRTVLGQCPPNQPTDMAIELLVGVAQLQRYLERHGLAVPRGQPGSIDCLELFGPHVRSWITNSQESLCATCRSLEATTELSSIAASATQAAPPLGSSEEGGVAPICHEMLRHVVNEMHRYEAVISHWPLFGPYLEAALCVVLRSIVAAVSRQCGMTRVRQGGDGGGGGFRQQGRFANSPMGSPDFRLSHRPGEMAQWAWAQDSPRKGGQHPRVLLMVREAVLLNSLKRLMVAVPIYEAAINKWTGGAAAPPPGAPQGGLADMPAEFSCEDVAPHVGAQFAQVVKELRTEYSSAVGSTCQRLSGALAASPGTSICAILNQSKAASANASTSMTSMQQASMIEGLSAGLFGSLGELLGNLAAVLDGRVFVATARGLWDFIGRDLLGFVENLQEGKDNKGAWRTRQNASLLLEQLNGFFRTALVSAMQHVLQERDLALPLHADATQKLLAGNTTALNMAFTPF